MSSCKQPRRLPDIDSDDPASPEDEYPAEQAYPCVQGLIAANVALMTAYANPAQTARVDCDTKAACWHARW